MQEITTIPLPMPFRLGTVNCYLVATGAGFVLVDTGASNKRAELENRLAGADCAPGDLKLIILTHGDFDHTGNAAYLGQKFGAKIAMHQDDAGMAEQGDMFWNRSSANKLLGLIAPILFKFPKSNRFKPDVYLRDGDTLSGHGFDARVLSLPGHSKGSIGILTAASDLFCGDLLENTAGPALGSIVDDSMAREASVEKLLGFEINTVYPGHGSPFAMDVFLAIHRRKEQERRGT